LPVREGYGIDRAIGSSFAPDTRFAFFLAANSGLIRRHRRVLDAVAGRSEGPVEYRRLNPVSHNVEPKTSFVQKLGDDVCGVGAYNQGR
jgi:hypothetical protein